MSSELVITSVNNRQEIEIKFMSGYKDLNYYRVEMETIKIRVLSVLS